MSISCFYSNHNRIKAALAKSFTAWLISMTGLLVGVWPSVQPGSWQIVFNDGALAQTITQTEVESYARSLIAIEPIRQEIYGSIEDSLGYVPEISCNRLSTLNSLPQTVMRLVSNYCDRAESIVEQNSLPFDRFNAITLQLDDNPDLKQRIINAMLRIQQESSQR